MKLLERITQAIFGKPGMPRFETPPPPPPPSAGWNHYFAVSYDGEKNLGEIGPIKDYYLDYESLRMRSWQSFLESEITQTVIKRFSKWVVGSGLKLQAEPQKNVLQSEGITLDTEVFNRIVEERFRVYSSSRYSDHAEQQSIQRRAKEAYINAIIGGDVLVILRYKNRRLTVQLVDGAHVCSPYFNEAYYAEAELRGNKIRHGIEIDSKGNHVAYYVRRENGMHSDRIEARGKTSGRLMAYLVYGLRYRLDHHRGMPLIAVVLETLKKLERYKEATVGSAEERQKIAFAIEHVVNSGVENPFMKQIAQAINPSANEDLPRDINGTELANKVVATTNKQAINLPEGAVLKMLESKNELYFKDFYTTNINLVCAAIGIPPEVALQKYDSNFSASRAALKDWEHTLSVERKDFAFQFYQPIYNLWLETEILTNKVQAPGFLTAITQGNVMAVEAYVHARFVGASVPHIDPMKEVAAERLKLGTTAAAIPLTTVEQATEALNGGDSDSNIQQYARELEYSKELKIEAPAPVVTDPDKGEPKED